MSRLILLTALLTALGLGGFASGATNAPKSFALMTATGSFLAPNYTGFTFGVATPPVGKAGTIEVDCPIHSEAVLKKQFAPGTKLTSAKLTISAELPKPQHFTYTFVGAKVASVEFVHGNFGLAAAVKLSFTKLTK
jgi:hypothetical protein